MRVMGFSMLGVVLPGFVVGPLLALVFGIYWPIFRVAGYEPGAASFLVLPVITLALPVAAYVARLMRNSMQEVLRANFIRTARAKGLSARARVPAARAAACVDPRGQLSGAGGGFRHHRVAGGRVGIRPAGLGALSDPGRRSIATIHWSWA